MQKETKVRGLPRNWIIEQYENNSDLTEEMKEKMTEYLLSLHGIKENSKSLYVLKAKMLGIFLTERGLNRFEEAKEFDLNLFLSQYNNENTLNQYIYVFKQLYKFLNLPEIVSRLQYYKIELEQITPSETLTPQK